MTLEEVKKLLPNLKTNNHDAYITTMIPLLEEYVQDYCNNPFINDIGETVYPGGVQIFIAKAIEYLMSQSGLSSRTMGQVSYSYDLDFPPSLLKLIKPYKKVRFV